MVFCLTLSDEELQELNEWLIKMHIKLDNRTRRDLSDVLTVARLVKKFNPRLVDMYNYSSHSSLALKIDNWEIFNLKVLRKLGLKLSRNDLEQLALGNLSALKWLLYHLMCVDRDGVPSSKATEEPGHYYTSKDEHVFVQQSKEDQRMYKLSGKHVPYAHYKLLIKENQKKGKYLSSISNKVKYLESLIQVKEERINNLVDKLATLSVHTPFEQG